MYINIKHISYDLIHIHKHIYDLYMCIHICMYVYTHTHTHTESMIVLQDLSDGTTRGGRGKENREWIILKHNASEYDDSVK
jgi:hypothetical protein